MKSKFAMYYALVIGAIVVAGAFSSTLPVAAQDESGQNGNGNNAVEDLGLDLPSTVQGVPACGAVVTEDVSLNQDLECAGNGLIVGASDVTINLNGHTIRSIGEEDDDSVNLTVKYGDNNGILVADSNNVSIIGPGSISGFDRAVTFTGSKGGLVKDIVLRDNDAAVFITGSSKISVTTNTIDNNRFGVVSESSQENQVIFNLIAANEKQGIVLTDSDDDLIFGNTVFANGNNGIFVDAQSFDNFVDLNNVFGHTKADINNANGMPVNVNRNNFGENNNCGIGLPGGIC
ncbi:MAG: right-handed parallel beta-helix repeat-containing protein [Nitrososphaera sp.]|jgi:parallel beta-helix repeat protein